ncbi:hypothetical protein ABZS66_12065 [Dactylosporangium sp. NPDC005572]|uniref:hypothetical protein n=1 Tax=Dactylosporangium sp. NPDC005572 TaxID=3156889 RepID=UPI0033AF801C
MATRGARGFAVVTILLAIAVALMHTISETPTAAVSATQAVAQDGPQAAEGRDRWASTLAPGSGHCECPEDAHERGHRMCQATAVAGSPLSTPPPLAPAGAAPRHAGEGLLATAADDAAHGSGSGAPALTQLSVLRT